MISFRILARSKKSGARVGILSTSHGELETPALVAVATQAVVKTLTPREVREAGTGMLICNTFHLHERPGEGVVKSMKGLHVFMGWDGPLMTDSGGFQVFSLGFGRDLEIGKIIKTVTKRNDTKVKRNSQPSRLRITEEGVEFRSPIDGKKLFLGPEESIRIQEQLGADIIYAFDECAPPLATKEYLRESVARTHRWARRSLRARRSTQALYGITQGSSLKELREESARVIARLGFDGYGIGGDLGESVAMTKRVLAWTIPHLEAQKPRHLLGIGHPENVVPVIQAGVDTFDCTVPTHYARHGIAFTPKGRLDLRKAEHLKSAQPLDAACPCRACVGFSRAYLAHLFRVHEITGMHLLSIHNLTFFNSWIARLRQEITRGRL